MDRFSTDELLFLCLVGCGAFSLVVGGWISLVSLVRRWRFRPAATPSMVGGLARVVLAIPSGGVGSIRCSASHARAFLPARSHEGGGIAAGTEVIIVEFERRIAVVLELKGELGEDSEAPRR